MKTLVQSLLAKAGYELFRRDARFHSELCAARLSEKLGISVILDVGANVGQYGQALREWGYRGKILSFEPLTAAHQELTKAAAGDPAWQIAPRCAVGAGRSKSQINVSANSVSSSLLDMLEVHRQAAPGSAYSGKEDVEIFPLDELIPQLCAPTDSFYLKIDTQGYEKAVLDGAWGILDRCQAVQLELSLTPLYDGGFMFEDGINLMRSKGFKTYAIFPGFTDRATGETFQVDGVFVRQP